MENNGQNAANNVDICDSYTKSSKKLEVQKKTEREKKIKTVGEKKENSEWNEQISVDLVDDDQNYSKEKRYYDPMNGSIIGNWIEDTTQDEIFKKEQTEHTNTNEQTEHSNTNEQTEHSNTNERFNVHEKFSSHEDNDGHSEFTKYGHVSPGKRIHNAFSPNLDDYTLVQNLSKVRSTLRQFIRDWSDEGKRERVTAYGPLLESLQKYLPIKKSYVPTILCPGSGLGRLPYEVAKRGYKSQGNEFSYFMLLASNYILNYYNEKNSLRIQPFCLSTSNRRKRDDHLKIICFPDTNIYNNNVVNTEFSMCAGELIEVYYNEKQKFDGILTCFFLDTAKNIFMYIRTFANILKPKGLWSNVGPLLYHYAEIPNEMSIELSWDEIKAIVSKWFTFIEIKWIDNYYTTNFNSMMQVQYHCVFFNALRNDVPVED